MSNIMSNPSHRYLFNFSSSCSGGGLVILNSYLEMFEERGGAYFIVNSSLQKKLHKSFKNNKIFFVELSKLKRLLNDGYYLGQIVSQLPELDLYFSFGIPIYKKLAKHNWLHISNLIPVEFSWKYLDFFSMIKMYLLGRRLKCCTKNVDILSADSEDGVSKSLNFLQANFKKTKVLKNGVSKDFVEYKSNPKKNVAVTVGTRKYKDLKRLYELYIRLKKEESLEELWIIGGEEQVPDEIRNASDVKIFGNIQHKEVIRYLSEAKIYLSSSLIENSSIASLEGLYLCSASYLSNIGSHLELIQDAKVSYREIEFQDLGKFYKVEEQVSKEYIKSISWEEVNKEFFDYLQSHISEGV